MTFLRSFAFVSLVAVAGLASAQTWNLSKGDIRSGVLDSSGLRDTGSEYGVTLNFDGTSNAPLYITGVEIMGGTNWNPFLNLGSGFQYAGITNGIFEFEEYTLGTAITEDVSWDFFQIVNRFGEVDSSVDEGFYDFSINILGGDNGGASDVLSSFDLELEVVDNIFATVTASNEPPVTPGDSFSIDATLNNNSGRDMITTTWYVAGFGLGGPQAPQEDQLILEAFEGDWFDKIVLDGQSRTDQHTRWGVPDSASLGSYSGDIGIIGGLYEGDRHAFSATPNVNIEVVPEPASMTALALGAAALLRRRKNG